MKANIQLGETVLFGAPYTNVRRKKPQSREAWSYVVRRSYLARSRICTLHSGEFAELAMYEDDGPAYCGRKELTYIVRKLNFSLVHSPFS